MKPHDNGWSWRLASGTIRWLGPMRAQARAILNDNRSRRARRTSREYAPMTERVSRRRALKLAGATAALPLVHISTAGAAGKLSLALWDHWVPSGGPVMKQLIDAWAAKNKVDVQLD